MSEAIFSQTGPAVPVRGVHLDLKGTPPTPERLLSLLDVFAAARYNAVLVEWEDAFPWTVDIRFRSETAYTPEQVRSFAARAAERGLEIIPLIQCLGHMETVLSTPGYEHLRETPHQEDVLNPLAPGASDLVAGMVDDVLKLMPEVRRFHLGVDEAWSFGRHPDTRRFIEEHGAAALYLRHVRPILDRLQRRDVRPLLWHDMMRDWPAEALAELGRVADLVVWGYHGHPDATPSHYNSRYIARFADAEVPLWGATAYKGADGHNSDLPNPTTRLPNAKAWIDVARRFGMKGVFATAWSRYSTHNLQCEPIDAALDLAVVVGCVLYNGEIPEAPEEAAFAVLGQVGEAGRVRECREAMRRLAACRDQGWRRVRLAREALAMASLDGRRRPSAALARFVRDLQAAAGEAREIAETARKAFAGLMPPVWIERYLAERLEPLYEEAAACEARIRQIMPAEY